MPERGKEDKMRGGVRKKFEGGYSGEGKEDKIRGVVAKKIEGGVMPERVKRKKGGAGWGVAEKNLGGGVCRRG